MDNRGRISRRGAISMLSASLGAALALAAGLTSSGPASAGTYQLTVEESKVVVDGRPVDKLTINGGVPGPTLRLKEGEDATITVTNRTDEATSVHWHGDRKASCRERV